MGGIIIARVVVNQQFLGEQEKSLQKSPQSIPSLLGAALFVHYQLLDNDRKVQKGDDLLEGSLLGPKYSNEEIKRYLDSIKADYSHFNDEDLLLEKIACEIQQGKVRGNWEVKDNNNL